MPYKGRKNRNSTNTEWPRFDSDENFEAITVWDEFTLENLNASYGHLLDAEVPEHELVAPQFNLGPDAAQFTKPDQIMQLLKLSDEVLEPALQHARERLQIENGTSVLHRLKLDGHQPGIRSTNKNSRIRSDHLIELDDYSLPTLVWGLGRPCRMFPARTLVGNASSDEDKWPLRQLANLCFHSRTRYGYILTEEDLLTCCFTAEDPEERESGWSAAIMPVPWTKTGEGQLTTDLALWWLCMLAISGRHNRVLTQAENTTKINEWDVYQHDDERAGWVRRHKYSKFEEPTAAPPPPPYQPPSPNNIMGMAAVFEAGVGINADPNFNVNPGDDNEFLAGHNDGFDGADIDWANVNLDDLSEFDFNVLVDPAHLVHPGGNGADQAN